jgi:ribosomal protein S18 acetylase RimI-like enzyme
MNEDALFDVLLGVATAEGSAQKSENYVYRNADSEIVGVLRVLRNGVFVLAVRSDSRRQGIATALLDAAANAVAEGSASPKPDFNKTTYSQDGQAFVDAYLSQTDT